MTIKVGDIVNFFEKLADGSFAKKTAQVVAIGKDAWGTVAHDIKVLEADVAAVVHADHAGDPDAEDPTKPAVSHVSELGSSPAPPPIATGGSASVPSSTSS
jgi:hypothetical protein